MRALLPIGILIAAIAVAVPARAEDDDVGVTPPMARGQTLATFAGRPVEITLLLSGRVVEPVTFFIRTPPKFGTLGEIRRETRTTARVVYTPAGGEAEDSFTFAAKSVDSPVSAAAKVRIGISEEPPLLEFERELDFGVTTVGEPVLKELAVKNAGGGVAYIQAGAQPPWTIVGEETFRVPAKKEVRIPITFTPTEAREFAGRLKLGNDPMDALIVRGRGLTPIDVEPHELVLEPEERAKGTLEMTVTNLTLAERVVDFQWPEGIEPGAQIVLEPRGRRRVVVAVPQSVGAVDSEVIIESRGFTTSVPFRVFPLPPRIEVVPSGGLNFGEVKAGSRVSLPLVVKNSGGDEATIRLTLPPRAMVIPDEGGFALKPGEHKQLEVSIEPMKRGEYNEEMRVLPSVGERIPLRLAAAVVGGPASAPNVGGFLRIPEVQAPLASGQVATLAASQFRDIVSQAKTTRSAEVSWNAQVPNAARFRVDRRQVSVGANGQPLIHWISWPEVKVRIEGERAFALIQHLPPDSSWTIRIVPISGEGKEGIPSDAIRVTTLQGRGLPLGAILGALALTGAVLGLAFVLRWRWLRVKEAHDASLSRLDDPNG